MFAFISANKKVKNLLWWIIVLFFLTGMLFSNAILPISITFLAAYGLIFFPISKLVLNFKYKQSVWWLLAIFIMYLAGVVVTSKTNDWLNDIFIKLPVLVFCVVFLMVDFNSRKSILYLIFVFNVFVFLIGLASFINYLTDYQYYNERIFQAKPIPIMTGLNHIYFSMMLAFATLCTVCLLLFERNNLVFLKSKKWFFVINIIILFFLLVILHSIAARTGLLAFYFAFICLSMIYLWLNKKYLISVFVIICVFFLAFLSIRYVSSLHNRFLKTIEDIQVYKEKGNINYYSFSTRVEYWKACVNIFKENPVLGVGNADVKHVLYDYLTKHTPVLDEKNRLDPHNQYLQVLTGSGISGFIIFAGWMLFLLIKSVKRRNYYLMALFFVIAVAFLGESILERQSGIAFVLFFVLLTECLTESFSKNISNEQQ